MIRPLVVVASVLSLLIASCRHQDAAIKRDGSKLTLNEPANQTMRQGESNRVAVTVHRSGFSDPVRVTFSNLPHGVSVRDDTILPGDSSKAFVLVATNDAAVVEKQIVTVHALANGMETMQTFALTVKPRA